MCLRASRRSGNAGPYLLELEQHKDHFLCCWQRSDICTHLINASMRLRFVLSQLFLRRRYCSCRTDVSAVPCWAQESARCQGLPCPAMPIKSVRQRPRVRAHLFHLVSSQSSTCTSVRKMKTHQACRSAWMSTGKGYGKAGLPRRRGEALELQLISPHGPRSNPRLTLPHSSPPPKI